MISKLKNWKDFVLPAEGSAREAEWHQQELREQAGGRLRSTMLLAALLAMGDV